MKRNKEVERKGRVKSPILRTLVFGVSERTESHKGVSFSKCELPETVSGHRDPSEDWVFPSPQERTITVEKSEEKGERDRFTIFNKSHPTRWRSRVLFSRGLLLLIRVVVVFSGRTNLPTSFHSTPNPFSSCPSPAYVPA